MILSFILAAAQAAPIPMAVGAQPTPWNTEACVKSANVHLPDDAETKRPIRGYRLQYLLAGDFVPILAIGKSLEESHPEVRTMIFPILKDDFLFSVEFDSFKGSRTDLDNRTTEVCRHAVEHKVKILGWQLLDGNKTAAGSYEMVGQ